MIIRWSATATLVLGMAGAPWSAIAQATGALTGIITDSSGAVVPGAIVEAINRGTAHVRTTVTSADGFYTIPLLTPAVYRVKAALQGFRTSIRDDIEVLVNETARADFTLEVGDIAEHITVEGGSSLVETRKATLGIVVDEQKIVDLPRNGRNFTQLGTLVPGVVAPPIALGGQNGNATPGGIGNVTGGFNVNGMRNQSNNFLLDGASNNDTFNTGFVLRPPPDAIQEFKILTHAYDAEHGRNAGSIVNVVTRSGTNAWHATAWEFNRDGALQARNFFAQSSPVLEQNQFGGAIGGPMAANRLFVFSYAEGFRNTEGQTDTRTVAAASIANGNGPTDSRWMAGKRHRAGTDGLSLDRHRTKQRVADPADESTRHDVRSECGRRTDDRSVVRYQLLPATDGGQQRGADWQRAAHCGPRPRVHPHRRVAVQTHFHRAVARDPAASRSLQRAELRSFQPTGQSDRVADVRADHER
jgi:hypothetical protein